MFDEDRAFRRYGIQIFAGQMTFFVDARVVVRIADNPAIRGRVPGGFAQPVENAGNRAEAGAAIDLTERIRIHGQVAVRIDEAGVQHASAKIDLLVFAVESRAAFHVFQTAHGVYAFSCNADGFHNRHGIIQGDDFRTGIQLQLFCAKHVSSPWNKRSSGSAATALSQAVRQGVAPQEDAGHRRPCLHGDKQEKCQGVRVYNTA